MIRIYLALGVIVTLGLIAFGFKIQGWHEDAKQLPIVRAAYDEYVRDAEINLKLAQAASKGLQDELTQLHSHATPAPVVRLCPPAKHANPVRTGGGDTRPAEATPAPGILPRRDDEDLVQGSDVGPQLLSLANVADEVTAQARATQGQLVSLAAKQRQ